MDNLTGNPNYLVERKKNKKNLVEKVVEKTIDIEEYKRECKKLSEALNELTIAADKLYAEVSKKQLNDFSTSLRMAKGNMKSLLEAINEN